MADQADVMDALQAMSFAACYPQSLSNPSITTRVIDIGQGWPLARDLDAAIAAGTTIVSIYAVPGTTGTTPTPFDWNPGTVVPPVRGMVAEPTEQGFQIYGLPYPGEYVSVIVGGRSYSVPAEACESVEVVAAYLSYAIAEAYPGTVWVKAPEVNGAAVTIPGGADVVVRVGAPATVGQISHRQKQNFQITVWAPTPADRTAVARAIDVALKRQNTIILPDTSTAVVIGTGSNLDDKRQETSGFHRALTYSVEWDTLDEYPAWEITLPTISVQPLVKDAS